jgi:hypothetical protein
MRKLILWGVAIAAASAAVTTTGGRSQAGVIAPLGLRVSFFLRKLSNSLGEAGVTVGTTADGGALAGTGVAIVRGAAWAGVVRSGGTGGGGQATTKEDRESNVRDHSLLLLRPEPRRPP